MRTWLDHVASFEDAAKGHVPRKADGLQKLEKARKWVLL